MVPFVPMDYNAYGNGPFTEGNAWQYLFNAPHDMAGLIELYGGKSKFSARLDSFFQNNEFRLQGTYYSTGLIGQYAHGNEPSHHVAYLFNYGDEPWKTQERVNQIMTTLYSNKPDGLCGNEDMGQMSAWYVFSAMGFYPVNPADGKYVFGTPLFKEVNLNIPGGKAFTIKATDLSEKNIYIKKVMLNGTDLKQGHVTHSQILKGGTLEFQMSSEPGSIFIMD